MERTKYTVHKSNIKDEDGVKRGHGEPAELGPKLARHYNRLGYLRPFIPEVDEDYEDDDPDGATPPRNQPKTRFRAGEEPPTPRNNRSTTAATKTAL